MTCTRFRVVLVVSIALLVAGMLVDDVVPAGFPEELAAAYDRQFAWLDNNFWPALTLAVLAIGTVLASWVGLFLFKRWGRSLSLYSTLASFVLYPVLGPSVTSALQGALLEASTLTWGAILALAYHSPVASRFDGEAR